MSVCEFCGNDYDKTFEVKMAGDGQAHVFDSFECAVQTLAPLCAICGVRIIGHGLEADGNYYCCDHCAEKAGVTNLRDRS